MRSRSTTGCRSSGLARRIILGAAALASAVLATPATGQEFAPYPPMKWVAEESRFAHADAHDEGRDILHWFDAVEDENWIYVTGFVTEMDGDTVLGTRFATFKYDAAHSGPGAPAPVDQAFFPSLTQFHTGDSYKAVALAVDELTGDIYVAGEGPWGDSVPETHQNYVLVKYDRILTRSG